METTQLVTQWIGLAVGLLVALGFFLLCLGWVLDKLMALFKSYIWHRLDESIKEIGVRMEMEKYWFHEPVQKAMWMACARSLKHGNRPDVGRIRDNDFPQILSEVQKEIEASDKHTRMGG